MPDDLVIPHGTKHDPKRRHPVLDIAHWEAEFPLAGNPEIAGSMGSPGSMARIEQARRLAKSKGDLGPSVPADFFVWSIDRDPQQPWLTQLGGKPWREHGKPWPKDADGNPLHFLGQICFADSTDILPCKLPGDVALIFGRWQDGWAFTGEDGVLEWSTLKLDTPAYDTPGWPTRLPFRYTGIIHRSVQYTDRSKFEPVFKQAGFNEYDTAMCCVQHTSISTHASLPQGWPFETKDSGTLIAALSSFYFRGRWPLCDVPQAHKQVRSDGTEYEPISTDGLDFGVGDAGCIWIYRDKNGNFKIDEAW